MIHSRSLTLALAGCLASVVSLGCSSSTTPAPAGTDSGSPPADTGGGGGGDGATACNGTAMTHEVDVGGATFTFTPAMLTICAGDTVHWVWKGVGHTVTSGTVSNMVGTPDGKFCNDNDMNCGAAPPSTMPHTYDHLFPAAGSFPYYCSPHASLGMIGTITVQ